MKTIEQISHEICDKYALTVDLSIPIEDAIKEAQRWIDVEDELPPVNELVIAKYRNYEDEKILLLNYQGDESELGYVCEWRPIELK
jgi:hypothetical protein